MQNYTLLKYPVDSFTWSRWRAGNPIEIFGERLREGSLPIEKIRRHAVGYCDAETLTCRPKKDCKAVLFIVDDTFCWCHLTNAEVERIFNIKTKV